jgi:hypothetical protein
VWDRYMQLKRVKPEAVLIRPGPLCPVDAKGPSPYYMTLRLYAKVYDKLTIKLDPSRGQFVDGEPNILLTCFAGPEVRADLPGVMWGFEELFSNNPKMARTVVPDHLTDISLDAWTEFRANELLATGQLDIDWYCKNSNRVLAAPRILSGALLFDESTLSAARVNYNADTMMSHAEMAEIEHLLSQAKGYLRAFGL